MAKQFVQKHVFGDVLRMKEGDQRFSDVEEHFGIPWLVYIRRGDGYLYIFLNCWKPLNTGMWSIDTEIKVKLMSTNGKDISEPYLFGNINGNTRFNSYAPKPFVEWAEIENEFIIDGKLTVEAHVTIKKMTGIYKENLRNFDGTTTDDWDAVLIVDDKKFHVLKSLLAPKSTHFKSLLVESFESSTQSEFNITGIDVDDFQKFLEVIYRESAIDECTVEGVLLVADKYDSQSIVRQCETFLLEESKKTLKTKLQLATRYNMEKLKRHTTKMASSKKEFVLKHIFEDVLRLKEEGQQYSEMEEHFGIPWKTYICCENEYLGIYLFCLKSLNSGIWSIDVDFELKLISSNEQIREKKLEYSFGNINGNTSLNSYGFFKFIEWKEMEEIFLDNGKLTIEAHVVIKKTTGIYKENVRTFDETTNGISDFVMIVGDKKFHVLKTLLAAQSAYFKSFLVECFEESKQSKICLTDIDAADFQKFLEVLHGEQSIDDDTIEGILLLAVQFDAQTVVQQCEEFLFRESYKSLNKKKQLATRYSLERLKPLMAKMKDSRKEIVMKHVFENVLRLKEEEEQDSEMEEHFGISWRTYIRRENEYLALYLYCLKPLNTELWSIDVDYNLKMISSNGYFRIKKNECSFGNVNDNNKNNAYGFRKFIEWKEMEEIFLDNGQLTIEVHVVIKKTSGIYKENLRFFDETTNEFSNFVFNVGDKNFHVQKTFLTAQSSYFNSFLVERFEESKQSKICLTDIDAADFQKFLEVLHGELSIDDSTVEGILLLANLFDAQTINIRCEEFLLNESKKTLQKKLQLATRYNLEKLKYHSGRHSVFQKDFLLKHIFNKVSNNPINTWQYNDLEEHFGITWRVLIRRYDGFLEFYLECPNMSERETWSVETKFQLRLVSANQKNYSKTTEYIFHNENDSFGWSKFIEWNEMEENFLNEGDLTIEAHVKIRKMTGTYKEISKRFDESTNIFSDSVLIVGDKAFHVLKKYLAAQSKYFKSLLFGNYQESARSKFTLTDIDSSDFQKFLEVLHGELSIDDYTVEGILLLGNLFDAHTVVKRCEEFLLKESNKNLDEKLKLATRYNLERLKRLEGIWSRGSKKGFVLKHTFSNLENMKEDERQYSAEKEYFNIPWNLLIRRHNDYFEFFLKCSKSLETGNWSIETEYELQLVYGNGKILRKRLEYSFGNKDGNKKYPAFGVGHEFVKWDKVEKDFTVDGKLNVEARVTIKKMTGVRKPTIRKENLRSFDDNEFSDVVLVANGKKFHVLKMYLAAQSTYFQSLLLGNFEESNKSEVTLTDTNSKDFQNFLEALYGELSIIESTVEGILHLADFFDAQTVVRQCKKFLDEESKMTRKRKQELSEIYNLKRLKENSV